jgi:hypothetical protein
VNARRAALLLTAPVVLFGACGGDEPAAAPSDTVAAASADAVGEATADLMPPPTVPLSSADEPPAITGTTAPPGTDPAVQAICDRTAIFLVTANGVASPSRSDVRMLDDSVDQLLEDGSLIYSELDQQQDIQWLTGCLDQAVRAIS